jgi:micrococcal nuclease
MRLSLRRGHFLTRTTLSLVTALALSTAVMPGALACATLRDGPRGTVVEVTDGDTIILDNGFKVRLIGMQAPKLPLGREGFETWPLAETAKKELEEISLGAPVQLRFGGEDRDRHGRVLAHMFIGKDEPVWAQEEMLSRGLARVYSFPDNRHCLEDLYKAEAQARAERLGIWSDTFYKVRRADKPESLRELTGRYELVEGRVFNADRAGSRVYLNFGRVWREDFTIVIDRYGLRAFADAGVDPLKLEGALVRVRGWIDQRDGPRIEVTHPEQIEVLGTR